MELNDRIDARRRELAEAARKRQQERAEPENKLMTQRQEAERSMKEARDKAEQARVLEQDIELAARAKASSPKLDEQAEHLAKQEAPTVSDAVPAEPVARAQVGPSQSTSTTTSEARDEPRQNAGNSVPLVSKAAQHLVCVGAGAIAAKVRESRNWICTAILIALAVGIGIRSFRSGEDPITIAASRPITVVGFIVAALVAWWLFDRWLSHIDSWSVADIDLLEDALQISYPRSTDVPKIRIKKSATKGIYAERKEPPSDASLFIAISDQEIAGQVRSQLRRAFGSGLWIGSPWVWRGKQEVGVFIHCDLQTGEAAAAAILKWRDSADG